MKRFLRGVLHVTLGAAILVALLAAFDLLRAHLDEKDLGRMLGVNLSRCESRTVRPAEPSFFGDGIGVSIYAFSAADATAIASDLAVQPHWQALPFSPEAHNLLFGSYPSQNLGIPEPQQGYWLFRDLQSKGDTAWTAAAVLSEGRFSVDFIAAWFNADTGELIVVEAHT